MGKLLEKYRGLSSPETLLHVRKLASQLEGRSVLHVYSGRLLGGVREMLDRLRDVFDDVGLHHQTAMLTGTEEFFDLVRSTEEGFSRKPKSGFLDPLMDLYLETMRENSSRIYLSTDLVVIHGVQPMGLVEHRTDAPAPPSGLSEAAALFRGKRLSPATSRPGISHPAPRATLRS